MYLYLEKVDNNQYDDRIEFFADKGEVTINTKIDNGTTFSIKLNQTIAIIDTLLIQSQTMYCLIPISDIVVCTQLNYTELKEKTETRTRRLKEE